MCGIGGVLTNPSSSSRFSEKELRKMSMALAHRGPDGEGLFFDKNFYLLHRLLRIHSPMTNPGPYTSSDGNWVLSFNGEIYNHEQLRTQIESSRPHKWKYNTDAEVLLEGWSENGESFLKEINGMFTFALWNKKEQKLILGRDRLGQKPLYYTFHNSMFYFASEIKAFKSIGVPMALNHNSLNDYFAYRYVPGPETLFKNIYKLQAGQLLSIDKNFQLQKTQYWVPKKSSHKLTQQEKQEQLFKLIKDAHQLCMKNVAHPQLFLSGGVDSSTIASFLPSKAQALYFSAAQSIDEYSAAQETARHFGHLFETVKLQEGRKEEPDEILRKAIWATEEPLGDSILIPTYALAQAARPYSRVVYSGEGADEVFAGYVHHLAFYHLARFRKHLGARSTQIASHFTKKIPLHLLSHWAPYSTNLTSETNQRVSQTLWSLAKDNTMGSALTTLMDIDLFASSRAQREHQVHSLRDLMSLDLTTWLPDYTLTRLDKIMMSQSLEARLPFLDHRLVEFTLELNEEDFIQGAKSKWILRKTLEGHLGASRAWRKKTSFIYNTDTQGHLLREKIRFSRKTYLIWREQFGINEEVQFPGISL